MPVNKTHARALTFVVSGALLLGGCDSDAKEGIETSNPGPQEEVTSNAAKHEEGVEHTNPGPTGEAAEEAEEAEEDPTSNAAMHEEGEEHTNPGPQPEAGEG